MEIVCISIILLMAVTIFYLLWKNYCLKRDIYDFTKKLEVSFKELLNDKKLSKVVYEQDDLWGMVYDRLCRISNMYTHKNQELYEEKEILKELVSDISHQIKTPLANIKLYQEMLFDETDREQSTEYLIKMGKQVDKLEFLLQNMVKMSRLETGTIKIKKTENLIAETLALAIGAVILKADMKNIQIHVAYDEAYRLEHDKKWTAEAIFNVLDNAVKYTNENGNIYISVSRETIFTKISITDTGKGISLERQGTIFNRFYREPEVHDTEGIGIGLYLAREIISMQNGYMKVESEVGKGSTFYIYLPN